MDDVTLGGSEPHVAKDVEDFRCKGGEIGLQLNDENCESISSLAVSTNTVIANFKHLSVEEAELLGALLTVRTAMDTALSRR